MKEKSTTNKKTSNQKDVNTKKSNVNNRKKNIKKKKNSRRLSLRGITTIAVMALIIFGIIIGIVSSSINKNNVEKVSSKLDVNMGKSITDIEKSTKLDFVKSGSSELLSNLTKFDYIAENSNHIRVCGVKVPKWTIYAKINTSEIVTQFTIYDFTTLEENILGTELANRVDFSNLIGVSETTFINKIEVKPYIKITKEDGSKQLFFRYYYRDNSTKNDISVQLCVNINTDGKVTDVSETDIDFISQILALADVEPITEESTQTLQDVQPIETSQTTETSETTPPTTDTTTETITENEYIINLQ